ncbi:MAG: glycosyltransferase family 4 protein [Gulosibacter sp.]|uniref:glycosyltransferase family 4 protein n=1 Tax=Gulosibacter sp. TaxID=2817531 RepID=UPI003F93E3E2
MRVLLLTHYFVPETGAPQKRWDALIREFVAAGHEVAVLCPPPHHPNGRVEERFHRYYAPGSSDRADNGAAVYRVGLLRHGGDIVTRSLDHLFAAQRMITRGGRLIRTGRVRPDVIIATAPAVPTLLAGQWLAKRFRIPYVVEMRDAWPDLITHVEGMGTSNVAVSFAKRAIHSGVTWLQRSADRVVSTTKTFAGVLESRGIRNVAVVRNGSDARAMRAMPSASDNHTELRALYIGTMGRSQGLEMIVRATAKLNRQGVPVDVRLVGEGHDREGLVDLNKSLGNPVTILDAVPRDEVAQHYAWADTTIASLRDWEPFTWTVPSKLYELLSTGRHVTGILSGESAELLFEAGGGDVVAPGNEQQLIELWRDLATHRDRLEVGDSGRVWVTNNVQFDDLAASYLEVLERVVHGENESQREESR